MSYNPFDKEVISLTETDILSLMEREIGEGWYIEYKREIPKLVSGKLDVLKICKSISSFANTKGGWIFWGISCDSKNNPVEFNGVDISDFKNFEDQLSQSINSNVSPRPIYHIRNVKLTNNNSIIILHVEEGPIPPYITSQGIIYQRESNESKPIKDRYIIEKLNEKTSSYYQAIESFCTMNFSETKGQSEGDQAFLELYLFPSPFDSYKFKDFYGSEFFKKVADIFYQNVELNFTTDRNGSPDTKIVNLNLGFNSIYSSERSLIIRPLTEKNLIYKSTIVELFENGNLKFLIPLREFSTDNIPASYVNSAVIKYLLDKYSPYEEVKSFSGGLYRMQTNDSSTTTRQRKNSDFVNHVKFIDGIELIMTLLVIITQYKTILTDNGFDLSSKLRFRARLTNCWRKFVFFDHPEYLELIKLYNIPLSPKSEIEIPAFRRGESYEADLSDKYSHFHIARFILDGIGLPDSHSINFGQIFSDYVDRVPKL